jgi:ribosome-binding factor A
MINKRIKRVNSLLKEVISEVIRKDVDNPNVAAFTTVTKVQATNDLRNAKVFVSIIGTEDDKKKTMGALKKSASFIAITSSRKIVLKFFPELIFKLDDTAQAQQRIEDVLNSLKDN